jgi:hypothetical protein
MIGSSDAVASAGASSVNVYMIVLGVAAMERPLPVRCGPMSFGQTVER